MGNTHSQLYVHVIFAVKNRILPIPEVHQEDLYRYVTGILKKRGQSVLAIGGMPDHLHIFFRMTREVTLSELMRDVKSSSSKHVNEERWCRLPFHWQDGYGAFTYAHSQVESVCRYIQRQKEHHARRSFREEYLAFLKAFEVEFDERYLPVPSED